MDQETAMTMTAKDYKRAGREAALAGFMNAGLACRNGNDLMLEMGLANSAKVVEQAYEADPVGVLLGLRDCAHNICYSLLNYTDLVK